ncbi:MAG: antirestriction protein ArdA [Micavibrio sp.]|nr:antirestriction protein ArdA [Micavibrio sp.]
MTQLYAQPYDISATGFYFNTLEEYEQKAAKNRNDFGGIVEEYELQFIDGEDIDCKLFTALSVNQATFGKYLEACDEWSEDEKRKVIIAVGESGYSFDFDKNSPDDFEVDIYEVDSLKELAEQFVDEGLYGEIPKAIANYLDYDAIARDLGYDYSEITIAGTRLVYRCS